MPVRIKKGSSRLTHSELVVVDGIEFWTRPDIPDVDGASDDAYYMVEDTDRIDKIAKDQYRREDWWWVIAHRNELRLLPNALTKGQTVIVPRAALVRKTLF